MRSCVLALVGPTGVGKTRLAFELAQRIPLEVVSADSRAVYRWMDIGTAKPTFAERDQVPHHLIDVVDPDEPYTLAIYQRQARAAIQRIQQRGRLAVLVGGAGLYVSAVCDGLVLPDVPPDEAFRSEKYQVAESAGYRALQAELESIDPESARRIDPKNVRRVIRALEVHHATGRPFSDWQRPVPEAAIPCVTLGMQLERSTLYERIDERIEAWIEAGFVEEVRGLLDRGYAPTLPSMSGLGYREIAQVLAGDISLDRGLDLFKQATHQYAKRQMTWFVHRPEIHWLDASSATVDDVIRLAGT
ncbi:MAG: tRNA (adenosine(37)-N6)-dimethylallyltransferase MiaA [Chloroflexi bacterium]|nr:tRNA (adenosine(37)-N6)-dimethylallyltransferase MiaA [Chloroflexota bacterium]